MVQAHVTVPPVAGVPSVGLPSAPLGDAEEPCVTHDTFSIIILTHVPRPASAAKSNLHGADFDHN